jgi:hypothetical protein
MDLLLRIPGSNGPIFHHQCCVTFGAFESGTLLIADVTRLQSLATWKCTLGNQ